MTIEIHGIGLIFGLPACISAVALDKDYSRTSVLMKIRAIKGMVDDLPMCKISGAWSMWCLPMSCEKAGDSRYDGLTGWGK